MNRRQLFQTALATSAVSTVLAQSEKEAPFEIVDTNVSLFRWPFRRLPLDETEKLLAKMDSCGISKCFAGSFEGIFQRDISAVNRKLARACANPRFVGMASINPTLPDWQGDLKQSVEEFGMSGIRLHPNYHGYTLEDPVFRQVIEAAAASGILIQLVALIEDVRTQNEAGSVADVDLTGLPGIAGEFPGAKIQLLNWRPRGEMLTALAESPNVRFDTARIDGTDSVAKLCETVSPERVLFGSHAPFLIPEASLIRTIHESGLPEPALRQVVQVNAENLLS